jgi:hypothetical protein
MERLIWIEATMRMTPITMRVTPPMWTMFSGPTKVFRSWVPARPARRAPMTTAKPVAPLTIALFPPRKAVEGSLSILDWLGRAASAATVARIAGMKKRRKFSSISMASL